MSIYLWPVIASWAVFIIFWAYSAFSAKRNVQARIGIDLFFRILILVAVYLVFRFSGLTYVPMYDSFAYISPIISIIAGIVSVAGIGFAVWARSTLGRNWGMPMSVKESPELVTTGPYRFVRHPIYTGVLLAIFGSMLVIGPVWLLVFVVGFVYFTYSAIQEEKLMLKEFPETYPQYKKRSKMLIPFVF